jgi:DNA-binding protein HU-beta
MNKAELVEALTRRLGDRKSAADALDAVLAEVQARVSRGEKVVVTGFGVFEKRVRAARTIRNPRTGEPLTVRATSVPVFRAGESFKEMVARGTTRAAPAKKVGGAVRSVAKKVPAGKTAAKLAATKAVAADGPTVAVAQIVERSAAADLRFTPGAQRRLGELGRHAEAALAGSPRRGQTRVTEVVVQRNLRKLLNEAAAQSRAREGTTIDLRTLDVAMAGLCPLPPWC